LQLPGVAAVQTPAPSHLPAGVSVLPVQVLLPHEVPAAYFSQAPLPSQKPSCRQVDDPWSSHWASGSWPAGTLMQVPALFAIAHDLHVPVQVVAQQTPCAQMAELQSALAAQVAPMGFLPQLPDRQNVPVWQSVSAMQVVLHCPPVPHMNGAQVWLAGAEQVPVPSQRPAKVSVEPVQPAVWQATPAGYFSHTPVPSQVPSVPQVAAPLSLHWPRGLVPRSAGTQVPLMYDPAQVTQAPVQALSQQTPSTQNPDRQAVADVHASPSFNVGPIA
jgi:hypothetical protein